MAKDGEETLPKISTGWV